MTHYDLHTHTNYSDGALSPYQLIALAEQNKVTHLAITDHDTVAAHRHLTHLDNTNIHIIAGIELSCQWQGVCIHIVGLNVDIDSQAMMAAELFQANARSQRLQIIDHKLSKLGFTNIAQGSQLVAGKAQIGRPHIAAYMVQENMVKNTAAAFKKYLGNGKVGDVSCVWPELDKVVAWIRSAGGTAVLAHPHRYGMSASKRNRLIAYFTEQGGQALEVSTANQPTTMVDALAQQCQRFDLLASVGSDFHGHHQWVKVGQYPPLPKACRSVWESWC